MKKITVLITDDHTLVREAWRHFLSENPQIDVIAECGSAEEAIEKSKTLRPNIVMMDINLPGMSGIEATRQIRKFSPGSKILGVSFHSQPTYARRMMQNGASGYVTKNSVTEEVFTAIQEIHSGRKYVCNEVKDILSDQILNDEGSKKGINSLSKREIEIIEELRKGYSSKEIASNLNISVRTVEVHRHNVLKKLNVKNSTSLLNFIHLLLKMFPLKKTI